MNDLIANSEQGLVLTVTRASAALGAAEAQLELLRNLRPTSYGRTTERLELSQSSFGLTEFLEFVDRTNVKEIIVLSVLALSPLFADAEDFMDFFAELAKRKIQLLLVEDRLSVRADRDLAVQELSSLWKGLKASRRRENALASRDKAALHGKIFRRKRRVFPKQVLTMRATGMSMKQIAEKLRVSESAAYRAAQMAEKESEKNSI